jgi:hypothetical protein
MACVREIRQPVAPLLKSITIRVKITGMRTLRARMWCAAHLFRLAAAVSGCAVAIDIDSADPA